MCKNRSYMFGHFVQAIRLHSNLKVQYVTEDCAFSYNKSANNCDTEGGRHISYSYTSLNCMDILKSEPSSSADACVMSSGDGNQVVDVKVEEVTDMNREEDPEPTTPPLIKTEPANCVDILRGERGACTETCSTSSGNGNQFLFVNVTDIKEEEDPEPATSPLIKTEPTNTVKEQLYACSRKCAFSCDVCNKAFGRRPNLLRHKRIHSGERPFSCDVCNKAFSQESSLITHQRIHSGVRPFSCDVCNKAFGRQDHLMTHKRIHSGERPFSCGVCNKTFGRNTDLMRHNRIHSGERPFSCDMCNKAFIQGTDLMRHKWTHNEGRPFSCDMCNKAFGQQAYLMRHKRVHSGKRPSSCTVVI